MLGLPNGIGWTPNGNLITISGTASENVSVKTEYEFTVESLGNKCSIPPFTGKITINPDSEISLTTSLSTSNQFICEGDSIDPIAYSFGGGTVDAVVSGLPPGVVPVYNSLSRTMTISGTPTQNVETDQVYDYDVIPVNNEGCDPDPPISGRITLKANAELTLLSSTNTIQSNSLC